MLRVWSNAVGRYTELTLTQGLSELGQWVWLEAVGLGLALWSGPFEEAVPRLWLRWCDRHGQVIPTGAELAQTERLRGEAEHQRAETERLWADDAAAKARRLAERLRDLGIDPEAV